MCIYHANFENSLCVSFSFFGLCCCLVCDLGGDILLIWEVAIFFKHFSVFLNRASIFQWGLLNSLLLNLNSIKYINICGLYVCVDSFQRCVYVCVCLHACTHICIHVCRSPWRSPPRAVDLLELVVSLLAWMLATELSLCKSTSP